VLANVLPGIREIRAPLAAGYLWLLCGWLIFDLPSEDALQGPAREVVDLAEPVPDSAIAIAVSFAAYLIGSISEDLFTRLLSSIPGARQVAVLPISLRRDLSGPAATSSGGESPSHRAAPMTYSGVAETTASGDAELTSSPRTSAPQPEPHPLQEPAQQQLEQGAVQQEIARLGNSIERLESENALRLALVPPLATLACYLAIAQDWLWALSLTFVPAFLAQIRDRDGRISREKETREELIQTAKLTAARALAYGRLRSVDEGRTRALKVRVKADLDEASRVIATALASRNWPANTWVTWAQTWAESQPALAMRLPDEEWLTIERAYARMIQLEAGLNAPRELHERDLTPDDEAFLNDTRERIESAIVMLDGERPAEQPA
jgi:hypothetical protein